VYNPEVKKRKRDGYEEGDCRGLEPAEGGTIADADD